MNAPIVHEWLCQVGRDLMSARHCAYAPEPALDRAAFFIQQLAKIKSWVAEIEGPRETRP
jgi:hypothetical protein